MKQLVTKADWHKVGHNAEAFFGASHALGYVRVVSGNVFAMTNNGAKQTHKEFNIAICGSVEKAFSAGRSWVEQQYGAFTVEL